MQDSQTSVHELRVISLPLKADFLELSVMAVYAIAVYNGAQFHRELCWLRKLLYSVLQSSKQCCQWVSCCSLLPSVLQACCLLHVCSDTVLSERKMIENMLEFIDIIHILNVLPKLNLLLLTKFVDGDRAAFVPAECFSVSYC